MDVGNAFVYMREDKDWVNKFVVASVLALTFIGLIPLTGWLIEITHRVIKKEPQPIPDWSDFGEYTLSGLKLILLTLVWGLPMGIIYFPYIFISILGPLMSEFNPQIAEGPIFAFFMLTMFCFTPLIFLMQAVLMFFYPAFKGNFATTKDINDGFAFKKIFSMVKANWANYLVVGIIGMWVPSMLATAGMFLFCIGYFPAMVYGLMVGAHLEGQVYLDTQAKLPG
jgi:hypothetical protein